MSVTALVNDLTNIEIPLENICLDPNNPRFVDTKWINIPDADITKEDVQESTRRRLIEKFGIEKLRMNMEVNGYLPIDRVIVRKLEDDKYVVLEGNRRICAAKLITMVALDGSSISEDVIKSLELIPCLLYSGTDAKAAWIFQGLRHITRLIDWSAYNKAKLLVEQMEEDNLALTEVGKRFGLTPYGAGQWVRGYSAFKQAREESDYVLEIDERSYPYFQELFSRSSTKVREWMEWDDSEYRFKNTMNLNAFVSWLYPKEIDEEGEGEEGDVQGDWENRWLVRRDDIRQVNFLIREAPDIFEEFRDKGELERLYSIAISRKYEREVKEKSDPIQDVFDLLSQCTKALENIPLKVIKEDSLRAKIYQAIEELEVRIRYIRKPMKSVGKSEDH